MKPTLEKNNTKKNKCIPAQNVVDEEIRELSAWLFQPSNHTDFSVVEVGEVYYFNVTAVATDRHNTMLEVNFKDGIEKRAWIR